MRSSNSRAKSTPTTIHSEGSNVIKKAIKLFDHKKPSRNFKFPTENATKGATAAIGKSE
jgi:hypothetical protein